MDAESLLRWLKGSNKNYHTDLLEEVQYHKQIESFFSIYFPLEGRDWILFLLVFQKLIKIKP